MNNQLQENNVSFEEFEKSLAVMIFEGAKGEIPKDICEVAAKNATNRMRYDKSHGKNVTMEEYVNATIEAYFD